jgi:hypothetical protein
MRPPHRRPWIAHISTYDLKAAEEAASADNSSMMEATVKNIVDSNRTGYIRTDRLEARLKEIFDIDIEVYVLKLRRSLCSADLIVTLAR